MNLREIAQSLAVSPASVSIVRYGRAGVSPATRRRIQLCLEENGYDYAPYNTTGPAEAATDRQVGTSRYIRLLKYYDSALLTDKNEGFVDGIINALDDQVRANGYTLALSAISHQEYGAFLESFSREDCAGLVVIATELERADILRLGRIAIPIVILDSDHPGLPFPSVTMNNRDLAYRGVEHLRGSGAVGYLYSKIRTGNFVARGEGYAEAVRNFGLPSGDDMRFALTPSLSGAYEDMRLLLAKGRRLPAALFADNDVIAIGAMRAILKAGYRIPQDVRIMGVDNTLLSQISSPALTTTQISRAAIGESAIQLLMQQMLHPGREPAHIRIGTRLILRESSEDAQPLLRAE